MNEGPSPVLCLALIRLKRGFTGTRPSSAVFFKNGRSLHPEVFRPVWIFKMRSRLVNESFILHFLSFSLSLFLNGETPAPSIYSEIAELCTLSRWMHNNVFDPCGFPVFSSSTHKPLGAGKCPAAYIASNKMVIISPFSRSMSVAELEWRGKKRHLKQRPLSAEWSLSGRRWRSRPLLRPLKRLLCCLLRKGREAWCQGGLWECRRRPADSAAIVPCSEALLRGYTEALCCSGLPSLSRFLLQCSSRVSCSASGSEDQPGALLFFSSTLPSVCCCCCS